MYALIPFKWSNVLLKLLLCITFRKTENYLDLGENYVMCLTVLRQTWILFVKQMRMRIMIDFES